MIGFKANGEITNHSSYNMAWDKMLELSIKVMSLRDVGGNHKYMKSLIWSFMTNMPDYALLVINPLLGVTPVTTEHYRMAKALEIPTFIVFTHSDTASEELIEKRLWEVGAF